MPVDMVHYSVDPVLTQVRSIRRFNRSLYHVTTDCFQTQHIYFEAANVGHFESDFILNRDADCVEEVQRQKQHAELSWTLSPQRTEELCLRRRLKDVLWSARMEVSLK